MKHLIIWLSIVIFAICWDYYHGENPVSVVVSGLQTEIHCNSLILQQLGFTNWAIFMTYSATLILIVIFLTILMVLLWIMIRKDLKVSEQVQSISIGVQVELDLQQQEKDNFSNIILETLEPIQLEEEHNFEYITSSFGPEWSDLCVQEVPPLDSEESSLELDEDENDRTLSNGTLIYSSVLNLELDYLKNQRKRVESSKCSSFIQSIIGIEIFTSCVYIYINDSNILVKNMDIIQNVSFLD